VPVLVQKYGGTSVGTPERIAAVADRIRTTRAAGYDLLVVVSAMGETTDHLLDLARSVSPNPPRRELDMLLTAGERISMALLAMALADRGVKAASFTGSQSGILTDGGHGEARIADVRPVRLTEALADGTTAIVAGFQGVSPGKEITTLGRGGSDTTAVALASAFRAEACEIYTDVAGVFTADPRKVPDARRIPRLSYREMATLAHRGAQVLHARSVDLAAKYAVPLWVKTSFGDEEGTLIDGRERGMEGPHVTGLAHRNDVALVELKGSDTPKDAAAVALEALARAGVPLDLLAVEANRVERCRLTWIAPESEAERLSSAWDALDPPPPGRWTLSVHRGLALVTVVGHALADRSTFAAEATRRLARAEVGVRAVRVDSLALSFVVPRNAVESALRALHALAFEPVA